MGLYPQRSPTRGCIPRGLQHGVVSPEVSYMGVYPQRWKDLLVVNGGGLGRGHDAALAVNAV